MGKLIRLDSVDSTNNYVKLLAREGAEDGTVVVADTQTAGRGRLGRAFQSPPGSGIYMSFLFRPQVDPVKAVNFTAVAATAVCDAIETACGIRPQIKWTNDLLLDNRKICGILTEMSVKNGSGLLDYLVLGIGINVNQSLEDFSADIQSVAGSIAMATGRQWDRAKIVAELINAVGRMYTDWGKGKWSVERYRADCATLGREVRIVRAGQSRNAYAEDIDDDFALVVRYEDGSRETIFFGEVSVRGLEGYM